MRRDSERGQASGSCSGSSSSSSRNDGCSAKGRSWVSVLLCVALSLFLAVVALIAYNLHSVDSIFSGEAGAIGAGQSRHRKFSGDYANIPVDVVVDKAGAEVQRHAKEVADQSAEARKKQEIREAEAKAEVAAEVAATAEAVAEAAGAAAEVVVSPECRTSIERKWHGEHTVEPPAGKINLVCCQTTAGKGGVFNIAVHPDWAPIGASNFMTMVRDGYFSPSSRVPLFRALKGFLIQFGLNSVPEMQHTYETTRLSGKGGLKDDPQWLPAGPPGRVNEAGVKRFQKGYLAYAGAGKNSRGTQLILAFEDNAYLGGGSPWEVPWGKLFGEESYNTLLSVYTGYGEKVSQGKIRKRGLEYLQAEFPKVDFIDSCRVMAEGVDYT